MTVIHEVYNMDNTSTYITINHLEDFDYAFYLKPGDRLVLRKDRNNAYDDEAIIAYQDKMKCGYVANSVHSVARGTCSAGRIYDRVGEETECTVRFVFQKEDTLIASLECKDE